MKKVFIVVLIVLSAFVLFDRTEVSANCYCSPNRIFAGPLIANRNWEFRTDDRHYDRNAFGGIVGIERLKPCSLFYRFKGTRVTGKREEFAGLAIHDKEWVAEGHIGYTFPVDSYNAFTITPFIGYGYFQDDIHFYASNIKATERYQYVPVGFLFNYEMDCWAIAWRVQGNIMFDRKYNDGIDESIRVQSFFFTELPLSYHFCSLWDIAIVPFYQWEPNTDYSTITGATLRWGDLTTWGARLEVGFHF